jgi:hypothetical protein
MDETALATPHAWESFYVIVGSTAGALTGLQFVVLTLISEAGRLRGGETLSAFGTPNVVHFCTALLVSAILSAPWHGLGTAGIAVALVGVGGLLYCVAVLRRAMRQKDYKPVLEDWISHTFLPMLAYAAMMVGGFRVAGGSVDALFVVGGATLLLVFVGIHNAWDTVVYVMTERERTRRPRSAQRAPAALPETPPDAAGRAPDPPG